MTTRPGDDAVALERGGRTYRLEIIETAGRREVVLTCAGHPVDLAAAAVLGALGTPPPYLADVQAVQAALDAVPAASTRQVLDLAVMPQGARQDLIAGDTGDLTPLQQAVLEAARPAEMATYPATSTATLVRLARTGDAKVAQRLVQREQLPVEVARALFTTHPCGRHTLTWMVTATLLDGARHRDHVRAQAPGADQEHGAGQERGRTGGHQAWLDLMATSDRTADRVQIASWPGTADRVLLALAADPAPEVRAVLVVRPYLPPAVVARLLVDPDDTVRRDLALRGHPDADQVTALAADLGQEDLVQEWERWHATHT